MSPRWARQAAYASTHARERLTPKEHANNAAKNELRVRRIHRRDLNRVWEFLKMVFRDVNRETVDISARG